MPLPAEVTATDLAAVNQILGSLGQAPVTQLDDTNPDVAIAYDTLIEVSREVQGEGWVFNVEKEYPITPDNDGIIFVPANSLVMTLSRIPDNRSIAVVQRDGKIYNKTEHTFVWPVRVHYFDMTWLFSFEDLPQVARDYICARASVVACTKMLGDSDQFRLLKDREQSTRFNLQEYECRQAKPTMFDIPEGDGYHYGYSPLRVISR